MERGWLAQLDASARRWGPLLHDRSCVLSYDVTATLAEDSSHGYSCGLQVQGAEHQRCAGLQLKLPLLFLKDATSGTDEKFSQFVRQAVQEKVVPDAHADIDWDAVWRSFHSTSQ